MSRNKYNWLLNVIMIVTLLMQVNGILVFGSFKLRSIKKDEPHHHHPQNIIARPGRYNAAITKFT